jgi:hypothetical protein
MTAVFTETTVGALQLQILARSVVPELLFQWLYSSQNTCDVSRLAGSKHLALQPMKLQSKIRFWYFQ